MAAVAQVTERCCRLCSALLLLLLGLVLVADAVPRIDASMKSVEQLVVLIFS